MNGIGWGGHQWGLMPWLGPPPLGREWSFGGVIGGLFGLVVGVIVLAFVVGGWWWKGPVWRWGWLGSVVWVHVELVGWQGLECLLCMLIEWLTGMLG